MMNTSETHEKQHIVRRVLLVEDDAEFSLITAFHLQQDQCSVDQAYSCAQAMELLKANSYDLILLDEFLPDQNGSDFCTAIRPRCPCPIIFLSCRSDSKSVVTALANGGDDYMVKPVNYQELLARAEAIDRRLRRNEDVFGGLREFRSFSMDTIHRYVIRNNEIIDLTPIEYSLLAYLADHPDTLLLYQELYEQVWSCDSLGDNRTVMVHISNLRKKLDPEHKGLTGTVRGVGYVFSDL